MQPRCRVSLPGNLKRGKLAPHSNVTFVLLVTASDSRQTIISSVGESGVHFAKTGLALHSAKPHSIDERSECSKRGSGIRRFQALFCAPLSRRIDCVP